MRRGTAFVLMVLGASGEESASSIEAVDHLRRLTSLWSGLPSCSVIVFRHIQKTGGSSITDQFYQLQEDMQWAVTGYWSPCWKERGFFAAPTRVRYVRALRALGERVIKRGANSSVVPPHGINGPLWATRQFFHLHHPDSTQCGGLRGLSEEVALLRPLAPALGCHVSVAMLVREPWSFFVSWYYYIGARRCGHCSFVEFLRLNLNAQSHLALGGAPRIYSAALRTRYESRDDSLRMELDRVLGGVDVLGITENLNEFMVLLCEAAGLTVCPQPGVRNPRYEISARGIEQAVAKEAGLLTDSSHANALAAKLVKPNATIGSSHRQAVSAAGWLDETLYSAAKRRHDAAMAAGGEAAVARRRQLLKQWSAARSQDFSTGCLRWAAKVPRAAAAAAYAAAKAEAREAEEGVVNGGSGVSRSESAEHVGERMAGRRSDESKEGWRGQVASQIKPSQANSSQVGPKDPMGAGGRYEDVGLAIAPLLTVDQASRLTPKVIAKTLMMRSAAGRATRCAAIRRAAQAHGPGGGVDLGQIKPQLLRHALLLPPQVTAADEAANRSLVPNELVMCSTRGQQLELVGKKCPKGMNWKF